MGDWIEIAKPPKPGKVKPDAVVFSLRRLPVRDRMMLTIVIGCEIAKSLEWAPGSEMRVQWSTRGPQLKIDTAPPRHPNTYALKADKHNTVVKLQIAALPDRMGNQTHVMQRVATFEATANKVKRGDLDTNLSELVVTLPAAVWIKKAA